MKLMNSHFLLSGLLALVLLASPSLRADEVAAPWSTPASAEVSDPWGSTDTQATDWQNQIEAADTTTAIDWLDPFQQALVPLDTWVEGGHRLAGGEPAAAVPADPRTGGADPERHDPSAADGASTLMMGLLALLAWQLVNGRMALGTLVSLVGIGLIGAWSDAMVTLSLVLTSLFFCVLLGLPPASCWPAASGSPPGPGRCWMPCRPPRHSSTSSPIVMLFGIGNVLARVVVTVIFACRR